MELKIHVGTISFSNAALTVDLEHERDAEAIRERITAMLRRAPGCEEWDAHAWDCDIPDVIAQQCNPEAWVAYAEAVDEYGEDFVLYVRKLKDCSYKDDVADWIDSFNESFIGEFDSREAWAEDTLEDAGYFTGPNAEFLRRYFDFEAYARDCELSGEIDFVDKIDSVLVFDGYTA